MRATMFTSAVTGVAFGALASLLGDAGSGGTLLLLLVFIASSYAGVLGIRQMREMAAERKRRGLGLFACMSEPEDFDRFYFPAWWRMAVWFVGAVAGSMATNAVFPNASGLQP